jgi:hypothetical protein
MAIKRKKTSGRTKRVAWSKTCSRSQGALEEQNTGGQNLKNDEADGWRDPTKSTEFGTFHRASTLTTGPTWPCGREQRGSRPTDGAGQHARSWGIDS